jgi:hypothetical protein
MLAPADVPSWVGYPPAEALAEAIALGVDVEMVEAPPPRWLSLQHEPRVARQRRRPDGRVELLIVALPTVVFDAPMP